jgi:hypothetical protein
MVYYDRRLNSEGPGKRISVVTAWQQMTSHERAKFEREWPWLAEVIKQLIISRHGKLPE